MLANGLCVCVLPRTLKMEEMNPIRSLSFMEPPNPKEEEAARKESQGVEQNSYMLSGS